MADARSTVSLVARAAGLDVRDLGDSLVVYDLDTRRTIALQPPASTLLTALLRGDRAAADAIISDAPDTGSSAHVEAALADLEDAGLIIVHDG